MASYKKQLCLSLQATLYLLKGYLAEVGALLRDSKVALLVRAAEQSRVVHKLWVSLIRFAASHPHPEEVLWFLTFI